MKGTTSTPYYTNDPTYTYPIPGGTASGTFNPLTSMQGSLPDPNTVISNYQMPPATYAANVMSTVPSLLPDVANQVPATLRKDLTQYITLGAVVASNYDPNLTAAWLYYISGARGTSGGRAGNWLPNFQAAFQQYVQPSIDYLASTPVPWNRVLARHHPERWASGHTAHRCHHDRRRFPAGEHPVEAILYRGGLAGLCPHDYLGQVRRQQLCQHLHGHGPGLCFHQHHLDQHHDRNAGGHDGNLSRSLHLSHGDWEQSQRGHCQRNDGDSARHHLPEQPPAIPLRL